MSKTTKRSVNIRYVVLIVSLIAFFWFIVSVLDLDSKILFKENKTVSSEKFTIEDSFSGIEEVHYTKMPLKYTIGNFDKDYTLYDEAYGRPFKVPIVGHDKKIEDIRRAFIIIEEATGGIVNFIEVNWSDEADIRIYPLTPLEMEAHPYLYSENASSDGILGLGLNENRSNVIFNGSIYFQPMPSSNILKLQDSWLEGRCANFPHVEIHEILHTFGFFHQIDSFEQIMFPIKLNKCTITTIDKKIVSCLKYIYSNGEIPGDCSKTHISPHYQDWEMREQEDVSFGVYPIFYALENCSLAQEKKIENAIKQFTTVINVSSFFYFIDDVDRAKAIFVCADSHYTNKYDPNTEYWYDGRDLTPALKSETVMEEGQLVKSKIYLFYPEECREDSEATPFEIIAIYRAIGIRKEYGSDTNEWRCKYAAPSFSSITINKVKEMYDLD